MTAIELAGNSLAAQMEYAKTVAAAGMLPDAYRNKPADILIAVGLGQSMGLSPAESLYRIAVIKGKPAASAELIAANVRKAGHRLRVVPSEDGSSVTATIVRADDPDFEHVVTRDLEWAKAMGLIANDNYKKQAQTMLQWRAITACARLACPEALYGVHYTSDELEGLDGVPAASGGGGLAAALRAVEVVDVEVVEPSEADTLRQAIWEATGRDVDRFEIVKAEWVVAHPDDDMKTTTDVVGLRAVLDGLEGASA